MNALVVTDTGAVALRDHPRPDIGDGNALVRPRGRLAFKSRYHGLASVDLSSVGVDENRVMGNRCGRLAPASRLPDCKLVNVEPLTEARFALSQGQGALEKAARKGV